MKKYSLLLFILVLVQMVQAQKITRVELLQSQSFIGMKRNGQNIQKVIRPVFQQDNATLICDSAYFYIEKNSFDAIGHVHINQADTVNIFADLLNYNGNTKMAVLTNNVRMVDRGSVLTTNNLTYNMASKVGTYTNGGKIVNGDNTLTSTNGYYFSSSSDAYFRYNVRVKTPEVLIKSDTLRYNSLSKIAYFYGPTHIYGKDDTLYTENGQYNTATEQAAFGKRNLYTQNSKSLKGDSLFYDGKVGYGRAVKNILFVDTAQKVELRGDLGNYLKKDESITVTQNAYIVFVTEKDSVSKDSIWMSADTLYSKVYMKKELYAIQKAKALAVLADSLAADSTKASLDSAALTLPKQEGLNPADSLVTDTLKENSLVILEDTPKQPAIVKAAEDEKTPKRTRKRKNKSNEAPVQEIATQSKPPVEEQNLMPPKVDSVLIKANLRKQFVIDSIRKDSIYALESDTTKIRVVSAWRKVRVFKSDLQARSDSAFFSYGDSTLRIFQAPMVWAQGSQISADTMYLQMVNKKMDNMDMIRNAIVVNTEQDSAYFNQVAGKIMKGYFVNEQLDRVFVDGNAESIYFPKDSTAYNSMSRTLAARMRINFTNDSLMSITFIRKPEMTYYPIEDVTEELKTLPNFSWKPKDRPKSKEEIVAKKAVKKATSKKPTPKASTSKSKTASKAKPKAAPIVKKENAPPAKQEAPPKKISSQ
nr:OstA-like protein [Pedobacter glucosidilyticus]